MNIATDGLDSVKNAFQVHRILDAGHVIFNKPLRRALQLAFF